MSVLRAVEAEHLRIVREIEQAREVVAFGLGAEREKQKPDPRIVEEALRNALALLEFRRRETTTELNVEDARFRQIMAAVLAENRSSMSRDRIGALAYLSRQSSLQVAASMGRIVVDAMKRAFELSFSTLQTLSQQFLVHIGWLPEKNSDVSEVIRRPFLPQEFTADLSEIGTE